MVFNHHGGKIRDDDGVDLMIGEEMAAAIIKVFVAVFIGFILIGIGLAIGLLIMYFSKKKKKTREKIDYEEKLNEALAAYKNNPDYQRITEVEVIPEVLRGDETGDVIGSYQYRLGKVVGIKYIFNSANPADFEHLLKKAEQQVLTDLSPEELAQYSSKLLLLVAYKHERGKTSFWRPFDRNTVSMIMLSVGQYELNFKTGKIRLFGRDVVRQHTGPYQILVSETAENLAQRKELIKHNAIEGLLYVTTSIAPQSIEFVDQALELNPNEASERKRLEEKLESIKEHIRGYPVGQTLEEG